jgi:hypothetical protein
MTGSEDMTTKINNPAMQEFAAQIGSELVMAQVLIKRDGRSYELRHMEDRLAAPESLRTIQLNEARALAQFTAAHEFRPLKSAPNLQRGWRLAAKDDGELEIALSHLYPGAVADWRAARGANPPVTHYREYVNRQSGMYRLTAKLTDAQAAEVARQICAPAQCLKLRLWTVPGLAPDAASAKSLIPCLEPCAVLMEAARVAMRASQNE